MPDPIDDLLAQIKADNRSKSVSDSPMSMSSEPEDSLDTLLAELDGRTPAKPKPIPQPTSQPPEPKATHPNLCKPNPPSISPNVATDNLLADLKAIYAEQDRAEQQRQATLKRQKRAANMRQAETWLKSLDSQSSEAAWFEEFAAKYTSRVEAAMDYLGLTID